jgi:hypothetical protein
MTLERAAAWLLLLVGCAAGFAADRPTQQAPLVLGGYRVLAGDFHVHSSTWSDGALTPWGLVLESKRRRLDVIGITGHDQLSDGRAARWFSERISGPTVLVGEEIQTIRYHLIALGVDHTVDVRLPAAQQIDEIHRQGGVAIAAHPDRSSGPEFDQAAMSRLDGAEICHPVIYLSRTGQQELEWFAARAPMAAIGSSDFHGIGRLGLCRTYVFAADNTPAAVLDALRAHRTVVYGLGGRAYGNPALVTLAATHPELRDRATTDPPAGALDWISRVCGVMGLVGLLLTGRRVVTTAGRAPA